MKKILILLCIFIMSVFPIFGLAEEIDTPTPIPLPIITESCETILPTETPIPSAVKNAFIKWVDARDKIYVGETMTFEAYLQGYDDIDFSLVWQCNLNDEGWEDTDSHDLVFNYHVIKSGKLNIRLKIITN